MFRTLVRFLLALFFLCLSGVLHAQVTEIYMTDIRSQDGQIILGVYKDQQSFKDEKPYMWKIYTKDALKDGKMNVRIELPPGTYGYSLLDDEDSDKEMNYNFLGIPKEGYGFSDFYHDTFSRPVFDDFKFTISKDETKKIIVKFKYF